MLDSLVRVSRRVGGATDLLATEMRTAPGKALDIRDRSSTCQLRSPGDGAPTGRIQKKLHPRLWYEASSSSRGALEKCSRREEPTTAQRPCGSPTQQQPHRNSLSLQRKLRETPPFTTTQFHVLLNSLFKVLFNFPSRYLFAIGLGVIFSLTWSLPRTLSCTPKQLDSRESPARSIGSLTGLSPSTDHGPSQGELRRANATRCGYPEHYIPHDLKGRQLGAGLCPFHSPLLRASRLFSFPPLINMLKFGG